MGLINWLRNVTEQLAINTVYKLSEVVTPPAYRSFLIEILQAIADSNDDPQVVYPLLLANLDILNKNFCFALYDLKNSILSKVEPEIADAIAGTLAIFGDLILDLPEVNKDLPEVNKADQIEIAIAAYLLASDVYEAEGSSEKYAAVLMKRAVAFNGRIYGKPSENQELARNLLNMASEISGMQSAMTLDPSYSTETTEAAFALLDRVLQEIQQVLFQSFFEAYSVNPKALQSDSPSSFGFVHALGERHQKAIYPILESNLEQLNDDFAPLLEQWVSTVLPTKETTERELLAVLLGGFIELLMKFPKGNQASNLEIAIAGYKAALQFFPVETHLELWIGFQLSLSVVYRNRIRGDKADNIELAIKYGEKALQRCIRPEHHREIICRELATAYRQRHSIYGDPVDNLKQAIDYCNQALQVLTPEVSIKEWAITQCNLGNIYADLYRLSRDSEKTSDDSEENFRLAVSCYEKALQGLTFKKYPQEWGLIQGNLGSIYLERINGDLQENRKQAAKHFKQALDVYDRRKLPYDWAVTQYSLGLAYRDLLQLPKAIKCFEFALEICQPTVHPQECFRAGRNLGNAAFRLGLWDKAITGYAAAIEAVELRRTWATLESRRLEITEASIDIYTKIVQACVNNGQFKQAIEYAERSRAKRLVDLMASNDLYQGGEISPELQEYLKQYEALQEQIDQERSKENPDNKRELERVSPKNRAATEPSTETIKELEAEKQQIWEQLRRLDPVLASEIQVTAPDLTAIQQLIDQPTTAILSFYTTANDTHVFVLRQNQFTCHILTGQGLETLQGWLSSNWLSSYLPLQSETEEERQQRQQIWHNQLSPLLKELSERLSLSSLIAQHLDRIEELILIPHLFLNLIPFAALPIGNNQCLGDKFLIRYAPSCQVLEFCQNRPPLVEPLNYGTVEDTHEDLPWARFEGEQVAQIYKIQEHQRLIGRSQATVENYRRLAKQVQVIHSCHHAQSRIDNPLESTLQLGDRNITLGELLTPGWRLPYLAEVFLSCCETGLGTPDLTNDILTFSTGFLCAGARSVVSTLWFVDDIATALLSLFYHQYRKEGYDRPLSLQKAQQKLRNLSGETLAALIDEKFQQVNTIRREAKTYRDREVEGTLDYRRWDAEYKKYNQMATQINRLKRDIQSLGQEIHPFAEPYYWAAFTCQGLR